MKRRFRPKNRVIQGYIPAVPETFFVDIPDDKKARVTVYPVHGWQAVEDPHPDGAECEPFNTLIPMVSHCIDFPQPYDHEYDENRTVVVVGRSYLEQFLNKENIKAHWPWEA